MQFIPQHSLGLQNAWWFSLIYGIASILILMLTSKENRKRILAFPKFNTKFEKIFTGLTLFVFARGLIIYSFIIPVQVSTINFIIGTIIYLIGMISSVSALWTFSRAELSRPVTNGMYKLSRHPIQVMAILMWIGIGVASWNWILIACAFLLGVISLPALKAQERFCVDNYGQEYLDYMKQTPRYLFV